MQAYKGTTVAGFPNLFFLVGPNTGLGHTSIVFIIESQIAYVLDALRTMRRRGARTIEVREEAQRAYNAELDRMTEGTVWVTGGCTSYYIDRNGHNSALWPTYTWPFRRRLREFDAAAYALGRRVPAQGAGHDRPAAAHACRTLAPAVAAAEHAVGPGADLEQPAVRPLAGSRGAPPAGDAAAAATPPL